MIDRYGNEININSKLYLEDYLRVSDKIMSSYEELLKLDNETITILNKLLNVHAERNDCVTRLEKQKQILKEIAEKSDGNT